MIHASIDVFCFRFCSTIRCNGQDCELIFRLCCEIILNIFRLFEATPFRPLCAGSSLFQSRSDRHPQVRNRQQNLPRVREPVLGPGESRDNSMIFLFVFLSWMLWSAATLLMPNYLLGIFLGNNSLSDLNHAPNSTLLTENSCLTNCITRSRIPVLARRGWGGHD